MACVLRGGEFNETGWMGRQLAENESEEDRGGSAAGSLNPK